MGWFNKNEEVPQIAPAPILPELSKKEESKKKDLPELPTFPSNSKSENFNQEMVKSAVGDISSPGEKEMSVELHDDVSATEKPQEESLIPPKLSETIPELPKHSKGSSKTAVYKTAQDPSWYAKRDEPIQEIPKETVQEIPKKIFETNVMPDNKPILKRIEPIFVRIDKIQLAQKNFEQTKEKIKEMGSVLEKIKDIKLKEEAELKGWTEDIEKIKSRLSEIDSGIFDQI